jgi:N-acetyl-gamma-glutamyl-phosphate/LysW-gamma-L-alpha-aminoadipyl-6-phosphate reductase
MTTVSIVGASGYTGGELLRILLSHPQVEIKQAISGSYAGKFVFTTHPNLRKRTQLKYSPRESLEPCDVLFLCLPHGVSMETLPQLRDKAKVVIDLSADFRLHNPDDYPVWYSHEHPNRDLLGKFVYGVPELHREEIKTADFITGAGCTATTAILGLYPLFRAGVVNLEMPTVIESKVGSSGAGGESGPASHHPERSGVIRSFKPTGHRHSAEIIQECTFEGQVPQVALSVTSVESVRGIVTTSHVFTKDKLTDKDLWRIYRAAYKDEPFMRTVKEASGLHRYPEPKILAGTNYCDVGFEVDEHSRDNRVVVVSALDNLMKGASGMGVQAMNIRCGFPETMGMEFAGLHPV